jgi:hypothetical protein
MLLWILLGPSPSVSRRLTDANARRYPLSLMSHITQVHPHLEDLVVNGEVDVLAVTTLTDVVVNLGAGRGAPVTQQK